MRRSTALGCFEAALMAAAIAIAAGGCQFKGAPLPLGSNGGTGGTGVAGATGIGTGTGTGGSIGMPIIDAGQRTDASGMSNPDMNCAAVNQGATQLPPDILIIQDRSGSMDWSPDASCMRNCGANSRWNQVTAALNQVVTSTDTTVNWGLKFFGSSTNSCNVTATPEVPIGPMNGAAIMAAIGRTTTGSPTPTRVGVNVAAAYMATLTDSNPKYLLLATDGLPTCDPNQPTNMNGDDSLGAEQAVTDAFNMGFKTFVVGIGDTMGATTLNQMAMNGGMPQTGAATSFYQVTDTASLVTALQTILGKVASCQFNIGTAPNNMTSVDFIDVFGDGTPIPRDTTHTDGWDYTNDAHTAIQVYGPRCDMVTAGTIMNVTVTFRCIIG
jgi:hypothetical protein